MSNPYQGYTDTAPSTTQRPVLKVRRSLGSYAGVFALVLTVFAVAGAVWGLLRPTYTAYVEDAETASVLAEPDVEFTAFIWFAITTGILGAVLALIVFLRTESSRGLGMMLWIGMVSFLGAVIFILFGDITAALIHSRPSDYSGLTGEHFQVVPGLSPGSALFAAPFLAVLMYWCATFVTPVED